jgi:DNA replication protein
MVDKLINVLKEKPIIISSKIFYNYRRLNMNEQDLVVLTFLLNTNENIFNPQNIASSLNVDLKNVMESVDNLVSNNLISIDTISDNGVKDFINLNKLYEKLALLINEEKKEDNTDIYEIFEKELGRTISPSELAVIADFTENYSAEIIVLALKEAVFNGARNLRYIDSILKNWNSQGLKTKEDVEKYQRKYKVEKERKPEIIDYDWLNESN